MMFDQWLQSFDLQGKHSSSSKKNLSFYIFFLFWLSVYKEQLKPNWWVFPPIRWLCRASCDWLGSLDQAAATRQAQRAPAHLQTSLPPEAVPSELRSWCSLLTLKFSLGHRSSSSFQGLCRLGY